MPVWHEATKELREEGKLALVGVVQEQHPERCRLWAQWQQIDWPILADPLNLTGLEVVPLAMFVDRHGILRKIGLRRPAELEELLGAEFAAPEQLVENRRDPSDLRALRERAGRGGDLETRMELASGLLLFGGSAERDEAVALLGQLAAQSPDDPRIDFRLGVAHRLRFDAPGQGRAEDLARSLASWESAAAARPRQYIWQRRVQQYGPRMMKPYEFYHWVARARREIEARGETPLSLAARLSEAELAMPKASVLVAEPKDPDPRRELPLDESGSLRISAHQLPAKASPGRSAHLYVLLERDPEAGYTWDPEAGPVTLWLAGHEGLGLAPFGARTTPRSANETGLVLDCDVPVALEAAPGRYEIAASAVYPICAVADGPCLRLRRDFVVTLVVGEKQSRR